MQPSTMRPHPLLRRLALLCALALVAGCTPKRIPGTDIEDTRETRAILNVMEMYRSAVEARDAQGVAALADPSFKDDGGSATTEDDLDYKTLAPRLAERLSRISDVKLELNVKKILFHEDLTASVIYNYSTSFKMPGLSTRVQNASEIKQMWFKRVGKDWKIASGI